MLDNQLHQRNTFCSSKLFLSANTYLFPLQPLSVSQIVVSFTKVTGFVSFCTIWLWYTGVVINPPPCVPADPKEGGGVNTGGGIPGVEALWHPKPSRNIRFYRVSRPTWIPVRCKRSKLDGEHCFTNAFVDVLEFLGIHQFRKPAGAGSRKK